MNKWDYMILEVQDIINQGYFTLQDAIDSVAIMNGLDSRDTLILKHKVMQDIEA